MKMNINIEAIAEKLKIDKQNIPLAVLIAVGVFILLDVIFVVGFQIRGLQKMGARAAELKSDIVKINETLTSMSAQKNRQSQIASSTKKIIADSEIPYLMKLISDAAHKHNVKITQMKPSKEKGQKDEIIEQVKVSPVTLTVDLTSGYHQLSKFLCELESGKEFMLVEDVKILKNPVDFFNHTISIVIKTYVK